MIDMVERFRIRHHSALRRAATSIIRAKEVAYKLAEDLTPRRCSPFQSPLERRARHEKRYARYREVMELHQRGLSQRALAKALTINRATVRKFIYMLRRPGLRLWSGWCFLLLSGVLNLRALR
jgi:DNA-binding NarL/FixJ family response regulator